MLRKIRSRVDHAEHFDEIGNFIQIAASHPDCFQTVDTGFSCCSITLLNGQICTDFAQGLLGAVAGYKKQISCAFGATEVISPQKAAGTALANRLGNEDYQDFYKLDNKYSVVSIIVNPSFFPITLKDMNPKNVYGVNLVLIKRGNKSFVPGGNDSVLPDDTVYVVGTSKEIATFREAINGKKARKK